MRPYNPYHLAAVNYKARHSTSGIVIHAALTLPEQDFDVEAVRHWHLERGWIDIGYHFVILRDGTLRYGRPVWATGAHVTGHNHNTVSVMLMGGATEKSGKLLWAPDSKDNFTPEQWRTLYPLVWALKLVYPTAKVFGHRDYLPEGHPKRCPAFDVSAWVARMFPNEPIEAFDAARRR